MGSTPVCRAKISGPFLLDGREVPIITAYLFHAGGHDDPQPIVKNADKCFVGSYVLGMGFTFDDEATKESASPISEMHRVIDKSLRNRERIFPYIGGEEINDEPTHAHRRYVINFAEMTEDQARQWPDLMEIVEARVRPERERLGDGGDARRRREKWWLWGRYTPGLFTAIEGMRTVLACGQTSKYLSFAFLPAGMVYSHKTIVVATDRFSWFAALQSRPHQEWADFQGSSMKDDPVYTPDDCFRTFPFPAGVLEYVAGGSRTDNPCLAALETTGREYYEFRAALMVRNNEGLTKTYNRFHDPHESSPDILQLRELHAAMDRAVLEAYGWHDLAQTATCQFLLDYEDEEDEEDGSTGAPPSRRQRKKPWRYRWPDDFRDEVLARLLELNKQRAEQERLAGLTSEAGGKTNRKTAPRKRKSSGTDQLELPGIG